MEEIKSEQSKDTAIQQRDFAKIKERFIHANENRDFTIYTEAMDAALKDKA